MLDLDGGVHHLLVHGDPLAHLVGRQLGVLRDHGQGTGVGAPAHAPDVQVGDAGGPVAGLGLWNSILGTILLEGALLAFCCWIYLRSTRARDGAGRWAITGLVLFTGVIWVTQPFSPPPPSAMAVATVGFALWLLPLWARWGDAHRGPRLGATM